MIGPSVGMSKKTGNLGPRVRVENLKGRGRAGRTEE